MSPILKRGCGEHVVDEWTVFVGNDLANGCGVVDIGQAEGVALMMFGTNSALDNAIPIGLRPTLTALGNDTVGGFEGVSES